MVAYMSNMNNIVQLLVILSLAGFFPISVIAYRAYQGPNRLRRLQEDFKLLGFGEQDGEQDITRRYNAYYGLLNYLPHVVLTVLVTLIGSSLLFMSSTSGTVPLFGVDNNTLQAMRYGFLGSYVFSVQLIYRRYTTYDLQPSVYLSCALTLIAGLVFNYVAFKAVNNLSTSPDTTTSGVGAGISAIIAFSLGYFPNLAIRWFNRLAFTALGLRSRRANELPLGMIDGISQLHEARLLDNGIDNVQNLASVDIRDLLMNTTFSAQQVIDWVDQAILFLYLEENAIESFRRASARTLSDFHVQWEKYQIDPQDPRRTPKALQFQYTPEKLDMLYEATVEGPNVHRVAKYWESVSQQTEVIRVAESQLRRLQLQNDIRYKVEQIGRYSRDERYGIVREEMTEGDLIGSVPDLLTEYKEVAGDELHFQSAVEFNNLAISYKNTGNYDEASKAYRRAIEIDPNYADAYNELAWMYVDAVKDDQNYPEALQLATKAVEIAESATAGFLDTLALAQIRMGKLDEAEASLHKSKSSTYKWPNNDADVETHLREIAELRSKT